VSKVGILALQGDFAEHAAILKRLDADACEVRLPGDLEGIDRLIIPGGESTTISRLMEMYGLLAPIRAFAAHRPVWGTCAGMIVMAKHATDMDRETLGLMDISVIRNAFGRQLDSFETDLEIEELNGPPLHAVFIRAPLIKEAGPAVKVMARLENQGIVAAREGRLLVTAFHPELTNDTRMHEYFLKLGGEVFPAK
jgi:pyridoxal 5'-phosphate synthase pdxT subunit